MKAAIVVVLMGVLAYVSGEVCQCAGFLEGQVDDAHKLHSLPDVQLTGCDGKQTLSCRNQCDTAYTAFTGDGNVSHVTSEGTTVAQLACAQHNGDVTNGVFSAYSKLCDGEWQHVGDASGVVCCKQGKQVTC